MSVFEACLAIAMRRLAIPLGIAGSTACLVLLSANSFAQSATETELNASAEIPVLELSARGVVGGIQCSVGGRPDYPRKALQAGASARVLVHIHFDKEGALTNVEVKGNSVANELLRREFSQSAVAAARKFKCDVLGYPYILRQEFSYRVEP
jgi:TonB family protein